MPQNWDDIKLDIMKELVNIKFRDIDFLRMSSDTDSKHLEERNSWYDRYWGTDENGNLRLDRVIAVYNAGPYGDTGKKARSGTYKTPYDLAKAINPTTASYISKIYGVNGSLDVATSDVKADYQNLA